MASTFTADYTAESRTVTPQTHAVSYQSWKKARADGAGMAAPAPAAAYDSRTAGTVVTGDQPFHGTLNDPANRRDGPRSFESALSMATPAASATAAAESDFSFDDVIDVINPLHHLPVVGMIYRELTGDNIGPVAQIIGGGIFGGPMGAIGGTVNAVVQETTGKDVAGNVLALVVGDDGVATPAPASAPASIDRDNPEMALSLASAIYTGENYVAVNATPDVMPDIAMGFAARKAAQAYERAAVADGRTAGWNAQKIDAPAIDVTYSKAVIGVDNLPPRDAITVMPMNNRPAFGGIY